MNETKSLREIARSSIDLGTSNWPVPTQDEIIVATLSGVGRIGMNWTLYGHDGRWLLVDAGIGFPDTSTNDGIRALMPDPDVLRGILPFIDALVVTHGHEDHIGAIAHLWPESIDIPIHAPPFAAALIASKLTEALGGDIEGRVELHSFEPGATLHIGGWTIETVRMTHSTAHVVSLLIDTPAGAVFHSGDWKFDAEPVVGYRTDVDALRAIGERAVLAAVCDSTNGATDRPLTSEADIRPAFEALMRETTGAVVICCMASNIARMASAAAAADASGRHVAVAGRSMRNSESIADTLGLLDEFPAFLAECSHLRGLDRRDMALVCTGTQGDDRAALARMSRGGDSRVPALFPGDVVVMSGRVIPGNEVAVEAILKRFSDDGVRVVRGHETVHGAPVHVTGHAGQSEMTMLLEMVRPTCLIPVHGNSAGMRAHAAIAEELGIASVIPEQGGFISLSRHHPAATLDTVVRVDFKAVYD